MLTLAEKTFRKKRERENEKESGVRGIEERENGARERKRNREIKTSREGEREREK